MVNSVPQKNGHHLARFREEGRGHGSRARCGISLTEMAAGLLAILVWIVLFTAGILINSSIYREPLSNPSHLTLWRAVVDLLMVTLTYTLTNVLFLCCLASFLGALGWRAKISGREAALLQSGRGCESHYVSALLRGFFVYLALLTGGILLGGSPLLTTTQSGYLHLAGAASLLSFLFGHDSHLFADVIAKVSSYAEGVEIKQTHETGILKQETTTITPHPGASEAHP